MKNKEKTNEKKSFKNFDDQTKSSGLAIEVHPEFFRMVRQDQSG